MQKRVLYKSALLVALGVISHISLSARTSEVLERTTQNAATAAPLHAIVNHDVGKLELSVSNNGTLGVDYSAGGLTDFFRKVPAVGAVYPKNSSSDYLFGGAFWIGAVVGRDTLVSVGQDGWSTGIAEFHPNDQQSGGAPKFRSTLDPTKEDYYRNAISEQDYVFRYFDTCRTCQGTGQNNIDGRPHRPIGIQVDQTSMAWSYSYAEDFVLFDYKITNVGTQRIRRCYMGVYVDADVSDVSNENSGAQDDICGFLQTTPAQYGPVEVCPAIDTVNIAWIADGDGDFNEALGLPCPHITATRIVRTPAESLDVSFNWWIGNTNANLDFGPQTKANFRRFPAGNLGTPEGDKAKYHQLRNREFDYDQAFTATIFADNPIWYPPPTALAVDLSNGFDTRYLLSFGPFDIDPGQTLPLSFAYIAGEDLHTSPTNWENNLNSGYNPIEFYRNLDFSDLGHNSTWASWIYDNPGFDSDSDGYAGKFRTCVLEFVVETTLVDTVLVIDTIPSKIDTTWYEGDNVPDFRGASPPPAPLKWVTTEEGRITIRFNGALTENAFDVFSEVKDFEGYRVHYGRDERASSFTVARSYDLDDYAKWTFDPFSGDYKIIENPKTLTELRALYGNGNPNWDPLAYTRVNPFVHTNGEVFYFEKQDFNQSELGLPGGIRKIYPNAPMPDTSFHLNPDLVPDSLRDVYLTEDGQFKYYEYEFVVENLLESVPYYVNVTAFDFGSPQTGLPPLETSVSVGAVKAYALSSVADVKSQGKKVFTWPNPYRGDGRYLAEGFEQQNFDRPQGEDRLRRIHFANLPSRCRITIYSLDGDMVREIMHERAPDAPDAMHEEWDLITRNTQMVASGLYYWTVEDLDTGEVQIGKLAIIL